MTRFCLTRLLWWLSPFAILSVPAHADLIQIGTLSVTSTCASVCSSTYFVQNLMANDTMTSTAVFLNGSFAGGESVQILPGQTTEVVGVFIGAPTNFFAVSGNLSSLDFILGGQQYHAAGLNWASPTLALSPSGGTAAITINAAPSQSAVPEPSSIALSATALLALAFVKRKSPRRSPL